VNDFRGVLGAITRQWLGVPPEGVFGGVFAGPELIRPERRVG
jgi:hypothetical protein